MASMHDLVNYYDNIETNYTGFSQGKSAAGIEIAIIIQRYKRSYAGSYIRL